MYLDLDGVHENNMYYVFEKDTVQFAVIPVVQTCKQAKCYILKMARTNNINFSCKTRPPKFE